jgi:hypothetical protein
LVPVDSLTINQSAQAAAFPSYFTLNDFRTDGGYDNGFASANFAAGPDESTSTPAGVVQSLNRYGRVDLTGVNAASCNHNSNK